MTNLLISLQQSFMHVFGRSGNFDGILLAQDERERVLWMFRYFEKPFLFLQLIQDLLRSLPEMFTKSLETQSALGPALQAAFKLMSPTGGRISVFQTQLPSLGVGALKPREEPNQKASAKVRETDSQLISPDVK